MTAGDEYDVVYLADAEDEFGRHVLVQTNHPRPVIGTERLTAIAWLSAWKRHGARQLNQWFKKPAKWRVAGRLG